LREIKLRPRTDQHDLAVKIRKARGFLIEGDKVKITLMFRGREMVHRDLGRQQLQKVVQLLGNLATVENPPRMEGRFLFMIVVPNHQGVAEARRAEEAAKAAAAAAEAAAAGTATEKAAEEAESPAVAAGE
jgi:translation initiation factor IF-3